ncbi:hypothetical protein EYF80_030126 [Liparis tanakae]|uniref:Uncharacterized protein n=1 Tax=Liparis tanakae TaxID=230148 RepID=A0A4Z2H2F6_9TELE|nr:hypothetical protein EYF80_030126 [Liparis tanakae]
MLQPVWTEAVVFPSDGGCSPPAASLVGAGGVSVRDSHRYSPEDDADWQVSLPVLLRHSSSPAVIRPPSDASSAKTKTSH